MVKASEVLINADESKHTIASIVDVATGKRCAIGELLNGLGYITPYNMVDIIKLHTRNLTYYDLVSQDYNLPDIWTSCPDCSKEAYLYEMIIHINDNHGWTFKQIGEWVKLFE